MPLIISSTYEKLLTTTTSAVYYMEIQEGRNDDFIINASLPGGAVMKISIPEKPATFDQDFPNAIEVDMLDIT